jgi:predicted heme/steroid binding protein
MQSNLALGRPATASSSENQVVLAPGMAVDGSLSTRWASNFSDPQWIQVDLGSLASISRVRLSWEAAYGKAYQIQVSSDSVTWTTIKDVTNGTGGTQDFTGLSATGRFIRMYGTVRGTTYGYSLWEFEVYGTAGPIPTSTVTPTPTATAPPTPSPTTGPLGPNVYIFDPSTSAASIQNQINLVYTTQHTNEFGSQRYALLFKPGTYNGISVPVGFYTHVAGLGLNPDDVLINGNVDVRADWMNDSTGHCCNATVNFWRAAENLATAPSPSDGSGWAHWAVSQAAPFRRNHVKGSYFLWDGGWASGGFFANTKLDGWVEPGSQQQFYSRNVNYAHGWGGAVWNMAFQGVVNAPSESTFPNPPYTTIPTTPVIREKPYVYVDTADQYNVFVPALRTDTSGPSWPNEPGTSIPLTNFLVVTADNFSVPVINSALAAGQHILFTPGIYHVTSTIFITAPDTVVLGMGMATLSIDNGVTGISVADVDGVKIGHLLIEGGSEMSPSLLEVGPSGSSASHSANPTSLHDVFFRLGGAQVGQATNAMTINSNDVIVDHSWLWRADHGIGVGWNVNVGLNGLVVNGNNVTVYGLFSEHFENYDVLWNGENGRCYYLQNEMAYDVPNQASWMDGASLGYSAYKVASTVTNHQAWGVGSYCLFLTDPFVHAAHAFEAPAGPGIHFHHLVTVSLGSGTIDHVINDTGTAAVATSVVPHYVIDYP